MPRPTPKLEDHPLSAVRHCLFNLFAATLHIGGRSSICNLRTRHAVVTGTHKHVTIITIVILNWLRLMQQQWITLSIAEFTAPFYITLWCLVAITQIEGQLILLNLILILMQAYFHEGLTSVQGMAAFTQHTRFGCGYICVLGLLLLLSLLQFLGWWLAWINSRAWHLPSRNLIISLSSVTHCETAFISNWFLVMSSTCSINIWNNNTSCKGMHKSNAVKAIKLLWNWVINSL